MPEGVETHRSLAFLKSRLHQNGRYPYLVNFIKLSSQFPEVVVESLRPALDQPLLDLFAKGKEYFFIFKRPDSTPENPERMAVRAHHGMKGHWSFDHPSSAANIHFRLDFSWDLAAFQQSQTPDLYLYYYNERFGQFEILSSLTLIKDSLLRLAPDFLGSNPPTPEHWLFLWSQLGKTRLLRAVLMDQGELCSGIGNYLLAEILYASRLHPDVLINQLSASEVAQLYLTIQRVLHGHYQKTMEKVVYKKKVSPEGHPVEFLTRGGRKIWYVPALQTARV